MRELIGVSLFFKRASFERTHALGTLFANEFNLNPE
jgi:hypothetical protein